MTEIEKKRKIGKVTVREKSKEGKKEMERVRERDTESEGGKERYREITKRKEKQL